MEGLTKVGTGIADWMNPGKQDQGPGFTSLSA